MKSVCLVNEGNVPTPTPDRIVLLSDRSSIDSALSTSLREYVPELEVYQATSVQGCISLFQEQECALAVLDFDLPCIHDSELLARLKLLDNEPEILLLSRCESPSIIKRIAESNKRYVVRDNQVVGSLSLAIRDLMRIRRLEREMAMLQANLVQANVKLQEQNDRLDDFCVTLAHDIRVPLSALALKIEHLSETQLHALNDKGRKILTSSVSAVHQLMGVVEATYDLSGLGERRVTMTNIDIKDVVERVAREVVATNNRRVEVMCDDIPAVIGNDSLLQRVFLNLIGNSVKYSYREVTTVSIRYVTSPSHQESDFIQVDCIDNGPGIPLEDYGQVFSMFKRGSNRGEKDGLGVGLAVVQRIVELHQGSVQLLAPSDECGCRVRISLPRADH